MLPPIDPALLQRNPNFEVLYKDLCTRKLNPDGSTRDAKKQRMHEQIRRDLTTSRTKLLKTQTLISTLSTLPQKSATLPEELHATIELITAQLTNQIPPNDRAILAHETTTFLANISEIASEISTQLTTLATLLCTIASPTDPPPPSDLPARSSTLQATATLTLPHDLADAKVHLANTSYAVLTLHRQVLETSIRILEQTQHGALARHAKARAEHLHARASVLGLQARIHTHTHPPPAAFLAALKNFKAGQGSSEARLRDREGLARRALSLYERAGEKGMRDLARRKEVLLSERERLEGEIGGLERGE